MSAESKARGGRAPHCSVSSSSSGGGGSRSHINTSPPLIYHHYRLTLALATQFYFTQVYTFLTAKIIGKQYNVYLTIASMKQRSLRKVLLHTGRCEETFTRDQRPQTANIPEINASSVPSTR